MNSKLLKIFTIMLLVMSAVSLLTNITVTIINKINNIETTFFGDSTSTLLTLVLAMLSIVFYQLYLIELRYEKNEREKKILEDMGIR